MVRVDLEALEQGDVDMRLTETVNLMCSNDWRDRFVVEYIQLQIRIIKL